MQVDPREQHAEAVQVALTEIEAFQTLINAAKEKGADAVVAVSRAVGGSGTEAAANALNGTVGVRDRLEGLVGSLEGAALELRRYRGGF